MSVHSSKVILPSQDIFCSSESLGMFKSFKNDSVFGELLFLLFLHEYSSL